MFGVSSQDELSQGLPSGGSLEDAPAGVPGTYEQSTNLERKQGNYNSDNIGNVIESNNKYKVNKVRKIICRIF